MYTHSPQTFLSLTAQRARHSSTKQALYDDAPEHAAAGSQGQASASSAASVDAPGVRLIQFTEIDDEAVGRLWADMRRSLGEG